MTDLAPAGHPTPEQQIHQKILRRAEKVLDDIRARRFTGRAPDIRTVDNRLDAATALIALVRDQLHELHTLGNDRPRASERLNVQQTRTDYALDSHGDPRARELYRQVALELVSLIELMSVAAHTMQRWLRNGEIDTTRRRGSTVITSDEFLEALAAQQRRADRGETDRALVDQPTRKHATDIATLERHVRDLEGVVGKNLPRLTSEQRGQLTTAEQMAHRKAVTAHRDRKARRANAQGA